MFQVLSSNSICVNLRRVNGSWAMRYSLWNDWMEAQLGMLRRQVEVAAELGVNFVKGTAYKAVARGPPM